MFSYEDAPKENPFFAFLSTGLSTNPVDFSTEKSMFSTVYGRMHTERYTFFHRMSIAIPRGTRYNIPRESKYKGGNDYGSR